MASRNTYVQPQASQLQVFASLPEDQPLVMLNLLKFKDKVEETDLSGKEQYNAYMQKAMPFLIDSKVEILYNGSCLASFIGPENELEWDKAVLVRYPDKTCFLNMISAPDYPAQMRTAALVDSRLIICKG